MKKLIFTATLFIGAYFFASAQEKEENNSKIENPNAPVIEFETEVIDYGTIEQGADGVREFKFKNTGKSPLIISNAKGSCGCTVPSWPKEPIKPGESGVIKVKYDTRRVGPINKSVTVYSNATTPVKVLRIKGTVKPAPKEALPVKKQAGAPVEDAVNN